MYWLAPDGLSGVAEDVISDKITPIIGNQDLGLDADLWSRNEESSYGKHKLFKGKLKALGVH